MRESNRSWLRRTLDFISSKGWEIALIMKIRYRTRRIICFGEEDDATAVIHSERMGTVLSVGRGWTARSFCRKSN